MSPKVVAMPMKRPAGISIVASPIGTLKQKNDVAKVEAKPKGEKGVSKVEAKPKHDSMKIAKELDAIAALPTLDEKVAALRARNSNVADVSKVLTPDEQRGLIGRFKTQAGKPTDMGAALKTAHEDASGDNTAKRIVVNAWCLDPALGEKFGKLIQAVSCTQQVTKREKWLTQLEVNAKWTEDEQTAHIDSGRLSWRETTSKGVFEFMDNQDLETLRTMTRTCVFLYVCVLFICLFWFVSVCF